MNSPLAYSIPETCVLANCSRTVLYQKISSGELRAVKCGRRTLVLANDIRAWLEALPAIDVKSSGQAKSQAPRRAPR
jgi:excisionase family DNA binding protein